MNLFLFKSNLRKKLGHKRAQLLKYMLMAFAIILCTQNAYSQAGEAITIKVSKQTIEQTIETLKSNYGISFTLSSDDIDIQKVISVEIKEKSLQDAMNIIFAGENANIDIQGNRVKISKRENKIVQKSTALQPNKVSGVVVDGSGEPLVGASVLEKGTTNGTITDIDGRFSFSVVGNIVLEVSYIGYHNLEISLDGRTTIEIVLQEDLKQLDEVVVVGYGVQKKVNLTGAVSSIDSKALTVAPVSNATNALAGRLPGLVAIQKGGRPGSDDTRLHIRGFNEPLVIVDGIEGALNSIDPNMIESISILKDASASIYGARAGHGVVLVTTKRGVQQKPTITLTSNLTMQAIASMPRMTSAGQFAELRTEKWLQ